jgi:hypothetical protein
MCRGGGNTRERGGSACAEEMGVTGRGGVVHVQRRWEYQGEGGGAHDRSQFEGTSVGEGDMGRALPDHTLISTGTHPLRVSPKSSPSSSSPRHASSLSTDGFRVW